MDNFLINLIPGETFLHRLTGKTKVRLFFSLIIYLIMTFDLRLILPVFIVGLIGFFSLKPNMKSLSYIIIFVLVMNLLNIFLYYLANPHLGLIYFGKETLWFKFTEHYIVTYEEIWFLSSRFIKMITTFVISLDFILSITPSELAAGLYYNGIPYKICSIVEIAFRYIPDISRDYKNIKISMQARGIELDPKKAGVLSRLKQNITILIPLVITSFDRIGNIANAMDLRGFGKGKKRSYYSEHESNKYDFYINMIAIALGIFIVCYIAAKFIYNIPTVWML